MSGGNRPFLNRVGWGSAPQGFQGRVQMPFAQQVPRKTSFWGGSERGRRGGGLSPGQEQGPGLLNKHLSTHSNPGPGPGPPPPEPFWLPAASPPSATAGSMAAVEGTPVCPLCEQLGRPPAWPGTLGKSFLHFSSRMEI